MTPTDDISALRDAVRDGARAQDADALWMHFRGLEDYVGRRHGTEAGTMATLSNVRSGVRQFLDDVRARAVMPFRAFTTSLSYLQDTLSKDRPD